MSMKPTEWIEREAAQRFISTAFVSGCVLGFVAALMLGLIGYVAYAIAFAFR